MSTEREPKLEIKIAKKIEEIPPGDWLSIYPAISENYYFFKTLDESGFDQFSFFYILISDNGVAVGAASCFLMRFPFDMMVDGPVKSILNFIKKFFPNIVNPRVLLCGLPMGLGRIGVAGDPGRIIKAICQGMEKIAQEENVEAFIFKDFTPAYDNMLKPLVKDGFVKIQSLPFTQMRVEFNDFDDYLKKLSRASRDGLKRKFKKVDRLVKIDMEVTNILGDSVLSEVHKLYLQTLNKMDLGFERVPADFFRRISINMPDEVKYFLWRVNGRLVAFAFCLVSGSHFIDYYLGFDYSVAHDYHLYFVRFRDLMKWCIAQGVKKYEMGVTTYEPKRRLGFDFIRLFFYIKHRNRLINLFTGVFASLMKPENFDPVFKMMKDAGVPENP